MDQPLNPVTRNVATAYVNELGRLLDELDLAAVDRLFHRLDDARERRAAIYVAGNGGSAATAAHWATDLSNATKAGGAPMRPVALGQNAALLTALSNDHGYEHGLAAELDSHAAPGDVLVVISASGSSPNLVRSVEAAERHGVTTLGLLGFDGGVLHQRLDEAVLVRTEMGEYELVEDAHVVVCHVLTKCLAQPGLRSSAPAGAAWT